MAVSDIDKIISEVAGTNSGAKEKKQGETVQIVVFELDREEYAVEINELREIIRVPIITPIPNSPDFIRGILNLRGKIVVVVDLEKRFSLVRENKIDAGHIVITEVNGNSYGVVVDKVREVLRIPRETIQPTPSLVTSKIRTDFLEGVVVLAGKAAHESRLIILLNLSKLLQEKELMSLGETIKKTTSVT
ncbi:MAG: chemotaxis protein CheW [bacterium]